jgi:O-antigen/teichoic acid export membrane protein
LFTRGVWVALGQGVGALGLLVGTRLLTEYVPPASLGTVSLLVGVITLGGNIFCAPQVHAASRFFPEMQLQGEIPRLRRTIGWSLRRTTLLLCGLLLVGGFFWSRWEGLSYGVIVAGVGLLYAEIFRTLETSLLIADQRQKEYALWMAVETWARPALALLLVVWMGSYPEWVLAGYFGATLGGYVSFRSMGQPEARTANETNSAVDRALLREIRHYALPLVPLALVGWVNALSDRYVIAGFTGVAAAGIYATVYGLISRPFLMLHGILLAVLRPVYFQAVSDNDDGVAQQTIRLWIGATVLLASLGVLAIWALKDVLAWLLLAEAYRSASALMPILALGFALQILSQVLNSVSLAYKESRNVLISETSGAVSWLIIGIPAVMALGMSGAALATVLGYFIQALVALWGAGWRCVRLALACEIQGGVDG